MAKKLAGVDAQMIGTPKAAEEKAGSPETKAKPPKAVQFGINLNFRVPNEFRRRFRGYAASHDMKLNEVLYEAFEALLEKTP